MSPNSPPEASASAAQASRTRRRGLLMLTAVVVVGGLAYWGNNWLKGQHLITTDNAYVGGHVVQITAQIPGTVIAIEADTNDPVASSQRLVQLDASDAQIALLEAEAELAEAVRSVRGLFATSTTLQGQIATREAEVARLQANLQKYEADVRRRNALVQAGAVGREEFEHLNAELTSARHALNAARTAVQTAHNELASSRVRIEGTGVDDHPSVQRAAAQVRSAHLDLQRTTLLAPVGGQVTQRTVQLGQRIQAGAPLMSVVPLNSLWVDANFKENQLGALHVGQSATLTADVYGKAIVYRGRVTGVGAGTGAAFALLPAQNATGNWIKIVQRVPVRIAIEPEDLKKHPLRIGLSMIASVDTRSAHAASAPPDANAASLPPSAEPEPQAKAAHSPALAAADTAKASATQPRLALLAVSHASAAPDSTPTHQPPPASTTSPSTASAALPDHRADALAQAAQAHVQAIIERHMGKRP